MSLSIVGSVAFDTLFTPEGTREKILGGSAVYSAIAASNFMSPAIIGVVGKDFHDEKLAILSKRNINIEDIQIAEGNTFHWTGSYLEDINSAKTINTEVGVLGSFKPRFSDTNAKSKILFLANNDPEAQMEAIRQSQSKLIAMDTMNLWINIKKEQLMEVVAASQIVFINDEELKMLTGGYNLISAAKNLMKLVSSVKYLVLKKGEHGSAIFGRDEREYFTIGAYPLDVVKDPTGAGDSFAGSFLGYLADKEICWENLKEALIMGAVTSSFTVQEFGPDKLLGVTIYDIEQRKEQLKKYLAL